MADRKLQRQVFGPGNCERLDRAQLLFQLKELEALAAKLGMTRAQIVYYERAAGNPTLDVVEKIAAFFGVTVGELLNDTSKTARKSGPPSQFARLVERLEQLPRAKQKVVAEMLEGVLRQAS